MVPRRLRVRLHYAFIRTGACTTIYVRFGIGQTRPNSRLTVRRIWVCQFDAKKRFVYYVGCYFHDEILSANNVEGVSFEGFRLVFYRRLACTYTSHLARRSFGSLRHCFYACFLLNPWAFCLFKIVPLYFRQGREIGLDSCIAVVYTFYTSLDLSGDLRCSRTCLSPMLLLIDVSGSTPSFPLWVYEVRCEASTAIQQCMNISKKDESAVHGDMHSEFIVRRCFGPQTAWQTLLVERLKQYCM